MRSAHAIGLLVGLGTFIGLVAAGCGSEIRAFPDEGGADFEGGVLGFADSGDAKKACVGRECDQVACGGGLETTVTGKVYAPNGKLALYNAIVYVPNSDPAPLTKGATCDKCGAVTGDPVVTALTDATGSFELRNVPVGKDVPLVIQIGKWRRQVVLPEVKQCTENKLTDPELTRLPKNQSEGDIPRIALTSGGCDQLGCMLPKIGLDASEFGVEGDGPSKSVHLFTGSGGQGRPGSTSAQQLWTNAAKLKEYDLAILSCECAEHLENKGAAAFGAMTEYLAAGGRIFTTDLQYTWYRDTPDADFKSATTVRGGAPYIPNGTMSVDTTFPKGAALRDWLSSSAGVTSPIKPDAVFGNFSANNATKSQKWADGTGGPGGSTVEPRVVSVNIPVGVPVDQQCGKALHIDAHVNTSGGDAVDSTYPNKCNTPLKPAENMLVFFFFDLASCIQNENEPPKPPPVK
jgi:hypothetical protein